MASWSPSGSVPPDTSRGSQMLIAIWTMDAIAVVVVATRLFTSAAILRKVSIPDYLMLAALVFGISNSALLTVAAHYGLGRHIMYLTPVQVVAVTKWQTLAALIGIMCPTIGRLSFTLYLLKLFYVYETKRYILHASIWINIIVNVLWAVLIFFRCGLHVTAVWDPRAPGAAHCWSLIIDTYIGYFQAAINSSLDLVLTCLPAWALWNLQMPRRVKIGIMVLLGLSLFAAIASIAKSIYIKKVLAGDITYTFIPFTIWYTVENTVVMVAASIPAIKPLFSRKKAGSGNNLRPYEGHTSAKSNECSSHTQSEATNGCRECKREGAINKSTTVMQNTVGNDDEDYRGPIPGESQVELAHAV